MLLRPDDATETTGRAARSGMTFAPDHKCPDTDRILVAQLAGEARHHARWRELGGDEEAAAVAGFRALAGGRAG